MEIQKNYGTEDPNLKRRGKTTKNRRKVTRRKRYQRLDRRKFENDQVESVEPT